MLLPHVAGRGSEACSASRTHATNDPECCDFHARLHETPCCSTIVQRGASVSDAQASLGTAATGHCVTWKFARLATLHTLS